MLSRFLGGMALTVAAAGISLAQTNPPANLPKSKAASAAQPVPAKEAPPVGKSATTPTTPPTPSTGAANVLTGNGCPPVNCCQPCCVPCGPPGRFWIDGGFLYWTTSGQNVPPLVTTAPAGTPRVGAGALGQPGTTVLFPTSELNNDWRGGVYLNAGMWLDCCQKCGIEMNFFYLSPSKDSYLASSDGSAIITRPFFN